MSTMPPFTLLMDAIRRGDLDRVKALVAEAGSGARDLILYQVRSSPPFSSFLPSSCYTFLKQEAYDVRGYSKKLAR